MTRHLLIIGAQRCGTTFVQSLLDAHPEISMARPVRPEPKAFLNPDATRRGLCWYRTTYFSHATVESLLGEKSTSYLETPSAAGRAADVLRSAEIVVVLRDPVQRAVSNWRFSTVNGLEKRPLAQALIENLAGAQPWDSRVTSVSPYAYLERGRYARYLEPWRSAFPGRLQVHFLEELVRGDQAIAALYRGLSVDPDFRPADVRRPVNASEGSPPELDEDLDTRLRDYYHDSDDLLRALLGRELPWGGAS